MKKFLLILSYGFAVLAMQRVDIDNNQTIMASIKAGNLVALQNAAAQGANLMITDKDKNNPLHFAVIHNHPNVATWLVTYHDQWLAAPNSQGNTPIDLLYGLYTQQNDQWNTFLSQLPQQFNTQKENALYRWEGFKEKAYHEGYEGFIEETPMIEAVISRDIDKLRELLSDPHVDINSQDLEGNTALMTAITNGSILVTLMLVSDPRINIHLKNRSGNTALIIAAYRDHLYAVTELLKKTGIDVNAQNHMGSTALLLAPTSKIMIQLLAAPGIDVNIKNSEGITPLINAVRTRYITEVQLLLSNPHIDVNAQDNTGMTALMYAVDKSTTNILVLKALLNKPGIDVTDKNNLLERLIHQGRADAAQLFWAIGAQETKQELSPAMQEAKNEGIALYENILKNIKAVNLDALLDAIRQGSSLMITDAQQNSPLHIAVMSNNPGMASGLVELNKLWLRDKNAKGDIPLDLLYGLWGDGSDDWNAFLSALPQEFILDKEEALKRWNAGKKQMYEEGHEGFAETPLETIEELSLEEVKRRLKAIMH